MTGFTFGSPFATPYYEGGGSTILAPYVTDVALGGHPFMIDWSAEVALRHASIPILRQQQDTSESPGEQSINSESLWRRFGESWHMGAGQERFDRKESSEFRFRTSQGMDIWNKWQLSLLPETALVEASASVNLHLAVAGTYLYYTDGNNIKYTTDLTVPGSALSGVPATNPSSISSNGYRVWTAHGTDGVYMTTRGTGTTASHITGSVSHIAYVKNRVMAANGPSIYDLTSLAVGVGGALPAALFTHGNTDWNWVGFAESQSYIYAAGFSGDKSLIYSLGITTDGASLAQPIVAGSLPDGEIIASVYGYLGRFLAIGTNKGFRLALVGGDGSLTIGALITTPATVQCFEGQERFIWYGLTNFSAITTGMATGLGRLDTGNFTDLDNFVPAYASDLMVAEESDAVVDVLTFQGKRVFTVSGQGIYTEHATTKVTVGALDTGSISYGLTEAKTALYVDLQMAENLADQGSIEVLMSTDGAPFSSLGLSYFGTLETFNVGENTGNEFEIRIRIGRDTGTTSVSPSLLSWLLRVQPRPHITNIIFATILMAPAVQDLNGLTLYIDTLKELAYIESINQRKEVVTFQHNNQLYSVVLEDYEVDVKRIVNSPDGVEGINASCALKLKRV